MSNNNNDPVAIGRALAAEQEAKGRSLKGRINVYACTPPMMPGTSMKGGCGYWIVTVDRDTGVTPMFVKCGHCDGTATSRMYKVGEGLEPTHEWYRPETIDGLDPAYFDHLRNGGLILRPIVEDRWLAPTPATIAFVENERRIFEQMRAGQTAPPAAEGMSRQQRRYEARKGSTQH